MGLKMEDKENRKLERVRDEFAYITNEMCIELRLIEMLGDDLNLAF